jgi:hypothetical protein
MFQQAHDALEEANDELTKTLDESNKKISSINAQLENEKNALQKAFDQREANEKLKQQLSPFLG